MAELSTRSRSKLPAKDFAEPEKRAYPVEDKPHARNAKARAAQAVKAGRMSKAEEARIDKKADAVLESTEIMRNPWLRVTMDAWALSFEASSVIGLRMMKLAAGGPAAEAEAKRMVEEKVAANQALGVKAMTGQLGTNPHGAASKTLSHYRRKVRANRRRLTKI